MILIAGALPAETKPLFSLLTDGQLHHDDFFVGQHQGLAVGILTVGVGLQKASHRCAEIAGFWPIRHIISVGTCGALHDEIPIGSVWTANWVMDEQGNRTPAQPIFSYTTMSCSGLARAGSNRCLSSDCCFDCPGPRWSCSRSGRGSDCRWCGHFHPSSNLWRVPEAGSNPA